MSSKIFSAIKDLDIKDIASRAAWTAAQAFLAVLLFTAEPILDLLFSGDPTGLYALTITTVIAGAAAGLSAVKTILLSVIADIKQKSV